MRWLAALALALSPVAQAAQVRSAVTQSLVQPTTNASGKSTVLLLKNPKVVQSGNLLQEDVTLTNLSGKRLKNVLLDVPLPRNTIYAGQATPGAKLLKDRAGNITKVRWVVTELAAGAVQHFRFRVRVK